MQASCSLDSISAVKLPLIGNVVVQPYGVKCIGHLVSIGAGSSIGYAASSMY